MDEEQLIQERKEKLLNLFKKEWIWVSLILLFLVILGVYIRYLPLSDHGGKPGLWDITTNDYTLGPDLDPWLFTRYAKTIIETGSLPKMDMMRNTPLGFDTTMELQMVSYFIVITYKILNSFGSYSINYSAAFMPVWVFGLTILAFFFFVREIFVENKKSEDILEEGKKSHVQADLIALISTLFMVISPIFLSRTVAGIPEKESVAFLFMFLSLFLFLKAWKSKKILIVSIFGLMAGISTGIMGLTWGAVSYIYLTIAGASFVAFLLNKVTKKEIILLSLWLCSSLLINLLMTNRFSIIGFLTSWDTGLAAIVILSATINLMLINKKIEYLEKINIPKNILSLLIVLVFGFLFVLIFVGPSFITEKISGLNQMLIKPVTGRWSVTVAENRQPYFGEWANSFGPIKFGIPILFWLFILGSILLFKEMLHKIKKRDSWILTSVYVLFILGLVFSRYSGDSIFNGENLISKLFYFGSAFLLFGTIVYIYIKYYKEQHKGFEEIDYGYIFLFILFVLCLFTARSAVRLIMVLGPVAPILASFLIIFSAHKLYKIWKNNIDDESAKMIWGALTAIILLLSVLSVWTYYKDITNQSYNFVPGMYNQQWQKAMSWVRNETPNNAVFSHWWDYGYWVQSIGERATMVDGGNAIVYWNYLVGRISLTGDNEKDSLDLLYAHNVSYFLVDSSDIGKYSAFSSIGSNEKSDRFSWVPVMLSDSKNSQETAKGIKRVYNGGSAIDEDIKFNLNGTEVFLPQGKAGIAGVIIEFINKDNSTTLGQPIAVFVYNNQQIPIPIRYAYIEGEFVDFKDGLEAGLYITQNVFYSSSGLQIDPTGGLMYFSPRMMKGFFTQKYIFEDPFNKFSSFVIAHKEQSPIVEALRNQGAKVNDFIVFQGTQGPITIWKIRYSGKEQIKQEYLDTDQSKYLSWQL